MFNVYMNFVALIFCLKYALLSSTRAGPNAANRHVDPSHPLHVKSMFGKYERGVAA
jgi:hypothetical protein